MLTLAQELRAQEDRLLACVHCGFCLPSCPTYTRLGDEADSPRGRLYLMRAVVEGRLDPAEDAFRVHIDRCLGCRACETVCPSGVEYGLLLERARAEVVRVRRSAAPAAGPAASIVRLILAVFRRPWLLAVAMLLSRILRASGIPRLLARHGLILSERSRLRFALAMLAASGTSGRAGGPYPTQRFGAWGPRGSTATSRRESGPAVALLDGCVQAGLFASVNAATARVLAVNGCRVLPAHGQQCCGALHAHAGDLEGARALARRNIEAFEASGADLIVVNAAGCGAAMKEYVHLLSHGGEWTARAANLSAKVKDATELLAALGPVTGAALQRKVTYDAPCHLLHAQRIDRAPLAVLASVPQLELVPLANADECCGAAGTYGLTHAEMGRRILADKLAAVQATGAAVVTTPNPGCLMQIGAGLLLAGLDIEARHPLDLLDESYERAGFYETSGSAGSRATGPAR
ncbi:MAG: 4Fe-4S dicluster domain-containing protein [Gemmatimonadetes bacterium]|nr:4Fe-4S dicluster domain-containing protein [Gemmatimonadota bacterium]